MSSLPIRYRHWPTALHELGLDTGIAVVQQMYAPGRTECAQAIQELAELKEHGMLSVLRGGRLTDLPRPLASGAALHIRERCPALTTLISTLEERLAGSELFLRALKFDQARASTTEPASEAVGASHFHFDAEKSSVRAYEGTILQFYLNLGQEPRTFRVIPLPLTELLQAIAIRGEDWRDIEPRTALMHYRTQATLAYEAIEVPSGAMAAFDGRRFAHDAGKGSWDKEERFIPSSEPDIVAALDLIRGHEHPGYDPEAPFLP